VTGQQLTALKGNRNKAVCGFLPDVGHYGWENNAKLHSSVKRLNSQAIYL
jgi:hypothetical protein